MFTDMIFACPARQALFWSSKYGKSYGYQFHGAPDCPGLNEPTMGSFHSAEL